MVRFWWIVNGNSGKRILYDFRLSHNVLEEFIPQRCLVLKVINNHCVRLVLQSLGPLVRPFASCILPPNICLKPQEVSGINLDF